jgi:hypothetical protein
MSRFCVGDAISYVGGGRFSGDQANLPFWGGKTKQELRVGDRGLIIAIPGRHGDLLCKFGECKVSLNLDDVRSITKKMAVSAGPMGVLRGSGAPVATTSSTPHLVFPQRIGILDNSPMQRSSSQPLSCKRLLPIRRHGSGVKLLQQKLESRGDKRIRTTAASMPKVSRGSLPLIPLPSTLHAGEAPKLSMPVALNDPREADSESPPETDRPHPPSFYCPISHQCMHDPVVLTDGHTYERQHIEHWLQTNETSPVSGAKLSKKTVFPNHALRNAIGEYFEQVFDGHRQAIKTAIAGLQRRSAFSNNRTLMHTIDSLMQCSILVNADLSIERVLTKIMQEAKALVGAEVASVFLVDRKRRELYSTVNSTGGELRIPIKSGVAGAVAYSGMPLIIERAYDDTRFNTQIDSKTGFKTRNILCVPIRAWKSNIIGVAQLINKTCGGIVEASPRIGAIDDLAFTNEDQQFLEVLAAQAGAAIVNSGMFECMHGVSGAGQWPRRASSSASVAPDLSGSRDPSPVRDASLSPTAQITAGTEIEVSTEICCGSSPSPCPADVERLSVKQMVLLKPMLSAAAENWETDVLSLSELTRNKPLSTLAMYLFEHNDLISTFDMDREKLERFFFLIEQGYPEENQYHNRAHAASVLHLMHAILTRGGLGKAAASAAVAVDDQDRQLKVILLAGLLAAIVHDFEHEGVNNDFLVKSSSPKAIMYNDRSPNENHHVAAAWFVLQRAECNFLENLTVKERRQVRSLVLELVLSTDMAEHGNTLNRFKEVVKSVNLDASAIPEAGFSPKSAQDATVALQLALKCADLGHLSLCWSSHMKWVQRLEAEFFAQGDTEVKRGMPEVSFLMDRTKPGASDSQVGFFDFVVLPLFREFAAAFPATQSVLSAVEDNYARWKTVQTDMASTV